MKTSEKLTTQDYWRTFWHRKQANTYAPGLPWYKDWYKFQKENLPLEEGLNLLEVGCANSRWLPIYIMDFKYKVVGVDYDHYGCQLASKILKSQGLSGEIICDDFFGFAKHNQSSFDLVVSFGVAEHFSGIEFSQLVYSCLRPGGFVFAEVPNFQGFQGVSFSLIEDWRSTHIKFTPESLQDLFSEVGFTNIKIEYAGGLGLPVPRPRGWRNILFPIHLLMWGWIAITYLLSSLFNWSTRGRGSASSIMVIAQKPF